MRFLTRHHRWIALLIAVCMVFAHVGDVEAAKKKKTGSKRSQNVSRPAGINDPRYAAIIMNPVTGEVYHQQDANGLRYPASLTKMMTLYLLFEALDQKKIDLDDDMPVSALAARQPQTNLSLNEGDTIEVETAIKSLVVRSANDVSVVVAEKLGGSVEKFARMMTDKARALGMKNTVFKNPNGLPNMGQYTTARDMAKLGIALKRDFPKYYPYFSTLQFSHNGVTYYTHNRVLLRYAGADGIKTGYINASGFNLVTSVVRGGRPLVGVVMGGGSGKWRDNRMIELLDQTYSTIASRGAVRGKNYPQNLPNSTMGNQRTSGIVNEAVTDNTPGEYYTAEETLPDAQIPEDTGAIRGNTPFAIVDNSIGTADPAPTPAPAATSATLPRVITPAPEPLGQVSHPPRVIQLAPSSAAPQPAAPQPQDPKVVLNRRDPVNLASPPASSVERGWGIQVGAFSSQQLADQAVRSALQVAPVPLASAHLQLMGPQNSGVPVYRARLENLTQPEAKKACELLISNNSPCFIFKAVADAR